VAAEQVLGEQQFAGPALEPTQVHSLADEVHPARLDVGDLAEGDEQITPGDARDQTGDGRMGRSPTRTIRSWTRPILSPPGRRGGA